MKVNDRVRCIRPDYPRYNQTGTVIDINDLGRFFCVKWDDGYKYADLWIHTSSFEIINSAKSRNDILTERTVKIIERGGRILLRQKSKGADWIPKYWYLHCWTSLAAGPDKAVWGQKKNALEFFNLKWAFAFAPLYNCKVVVVYPKSKKAVPTVPHDNSLCLDRQCQYYGRIHPVEYTHDH